MYKWEAIKVGDLGDIKTGKTPKTSKKENYGGNIPFLTPSDDMSVKYVINTIKHITEIGLNEVKNVLLPQNSVCVSCIGSDLGKVVITTVPTVTNQQINSIIVDTENYNVDFCYYLMLQLGKILNYHSKTSTAVPIINKNSFSNYDILVPELKIQEKIANILSPIDEKIAINNAINNNLEQQAMALFRNKFINNINTNHTTCKAEEYFDISIGKTPPRKETEWFSRTDGIKWVSISDMGNCGMYISDSSEYITSSAIDKYNIKIVPDNTVILSFKLTVGRVAITDGKMATNEAIAHFKTNDKRINEYLYCYLKSFNYQTMGSTSSIATAVNSKIIKAMPFIVPTNEEIDRFHNIVNPMFNKIKLNQTENVRLTQLRDTLLPKLMSGEIDVSNVKIDEKFDGSSTDKLSFSYIYIVIYEPFIIIIVIIIVGVNYEKTVYYIIILFYFLYL